MPTPNWTSVGLPNELAKEISEIARAEDRTKYAVVRRAIHLYRQQSERLTRRAAERR
jgi:predicted transcriptional regulator